MAMFIRVKRKKTTYFLHCDPTETVLEIKQKIQALSDNPVDCQRLILLGSQLVLEDSKTLADQKVENDAIVALCLKISDPRVHRVPTLMRSPYIPPTPSPTPTPPYRLPQEEKDTELGEDSSLGGISSKKDGSIKESVKKETQKDGGKKEVKKETSKNDGGKKEVKKDAKKDMTKKDIPKKGAEKKQGREPPGKGGKETSKNGRKKTTKEEVPPPAEETDEPPEDGVWEDITIDKLTDYATLEDSD